MSRRSQELQELREVVRSEQRLWAWGSDEGISPWEDRHGRLMLTFWKSESRAIEENQSDMEPGEGAVPYPVTTLLNKLESWAEAGVEVYGLEPRRGKVLYSLDSMEFRSFLLGESAGPELP